MKKTFQYNKSCKINYWGCSFDSLLELKFAIYIREEYEFLHNWIPVYFDPSTKQAASHIRRNIRRYTPDFLIRNKQTNKAYWVEIKPRAYTDEKQLEIRSQVAENYIRQKGYDWEFKIIYDDEIILTLDQIIQFNECARFLTQSSHNEKYEQYHQQYNRILPSFPSTVLNRNRIQFVMFGERLKKGFLKV